MISIEEKVMDSYLDNVWPFASRLFLLIVIGFVLNLITSLDEATFSGFSLLFVCIGYIPYIFFQIARADADSKRYDVEEAIEMTREATSKYNQAIAQRNQVAKIAGDWKDKATESARKSGAIAKEVERLRASERSMIDKIQSLQTELANANKGLASADELLATAKASEQKAVASAVATAKATARPYTTLATLYARERSLMSIINNNTLPKEEREEAKAKRELLKGDMAKALEIVQKKEVQNG